MKQKLIKWGGILLTTCMGWGWIVGSDFVSVLLLGEYPYPTDNDN